MSEHLRIVQVNCAKNPDTVDGLLERLIPSTHIILVQEPVWSDIGNGVRGPQGRTEWTPFIPLYPIPDDVTPSVMAYVNNDLWDASCVRARPDVFSDQRAMALDLILPSGTLQVWNIYNPPRNYRGNDAQYYDMMGKLLSMDVLGKSVFMAGDFNLHHQEWDPTMEGNSPGSDEFVAWAAAQSFSLLNTLGVVTRKAQTTKQVDSILDLTYMTLAASAAFPPTGWIADRSIAPVSDHVALVTTLYLHPDTGLPQKASGRFDNFRRANISDFQQALAGTLSRHRRLFENPDTPCTTLWEIFLDACTYAASASTPPITRQPKNGWWNPTLSRLRDEVAFFYDKMRGCAVHTGAHADLALKWVEAKRQFKKAIRASKKLYFQNLLENAKPSDIWRFQKWGKGTRPYTSPPLVDPRLPRGSPPTGISVEQKADIFRHQFFPKAGAADPPCPDFGPPKPRWDFPEITTEEIRKSVFDPSIKKAPGASGMTFGVLRTAWNVASMEICAIIRRSFIHADVPPDWKKEIVAVIPKLGKPDYSIPKAYRPIALIECIAKVVERVVSCRLGYLNQSLQLAPDQFAGTPGLGMVDALQFAIHHIQQARARNRQVSIMKFDIKGFFNTIPRNVLIALLRSEGCPEIVLAWLDAFLDDRTCQFKIDRVLTELYRTYGDRPSPPCLVCSSPPT